ncbi:MAG: hypothetical protein JWQ33_1040 [Ramlibacter sp.]|nr:hypothetical protein [Ramlibacter sp.]
MSALDAVVLAATQAWLERAVIGLNLCPFAKAVHAKGQIHFAISAADSPARVLEDFVAELDALIAHDPTERETTLLVVPHCLHEFLEFNDLVARADRLIRKRGCEGVVQLATFHPDYRFADSSEGDMANFTNRSPYPTLHLLRETSIARAVEAFANPESIYGANIATLRKLGPAGWAALNVGAVQ